MEIKRFIQSPVALLTKARILIEPFLRSPHRVTRRGQLRDLEKSILRKLV